jgi:hypothetical protein
MRVTRSSGILALLTLLLCSSVTARAAAPPSASWTIFHVTVAGQDTWSAWYSHAPWPFRVRFKCEGGAVVMNAVNTDAMHQTVSVHHWNIEATEDALNRSMQSGRALQNRGFVLQARQSTTLPIHRNVCGSASNSFVYGAVLGV